MEQFAGGDLTKRGRHQRASVKLFSLRLCTRHERSCLGSPWSPISHFHCLTFETSVFGDLHARDAPTVHIDFLNDDESRCGILIQNPDQKIRNPLDEFCFLFDRGSFARELNIHLRHVKSFPCLLCSRSLMHI